MSIETLWYIARGTGLVTVLALSASVALGVLTTMKWSAPRWPRFMSADLHRNVSLLAMAFLAVHIVTTVLDPVSPVRLVNALVPFTGSFRPLAIGLGVVAFDLLLALAVTSALRRRIGYRAWRAVHWSAYACWPFAMMHGLTAGTDTATHWARGVYLLSGGLVVAAVAWRMTSVLQPARVPATRPRIASGR